MAAIKAKPSLLTLPLELREEIYTNLLLSPFAPASSSTSKISKEHTRSWWLQDQWKFNAYNVYFPDRPSSGAQLYVSSPLLQASRQLRAETMSVILRLQKQKQVPWRLELRTLSEDSLEAKWTHLPIPPNLYHPCSSSFADPKRAIPNLDPIDLPSLHALGDTRSQVPPSVPLHKPSGRLAKTGHDVVASFEITPIEDREIIWAKDRGDVSQTVSNLLAVVGSWCTNGFAFTHTQGPVPFIDTLTILLRPPYPTHAVTDSEIETALGISKKGKASRDQLLDRMINSKHQSRHLIGLRTLLREFAENGLLHGYVRSIKIGVERVQFRHMDSGQETDCDTTGEHNDESDNGENQESDEAITIYNESETIWDPEEDGDTVDIVEEIEVLNQPLVNKTLTAAYWEHYGWMPEYPKWEGRVSRSYLPYGGLSTFYWNSGEDMPDSDEY